MKKLFNLDVKDIMNTVSTAAAASLLHDVLFAGKKDDDSDDTMRLVRNILIVVGAVVVVAGAVYAIVRFLQPKDKEEKEGGYCFLCGKKKKAKAVEELEEDACCEACDEEEACEEAADSVCTCGCAAEPAEAFEAKREEKAETATTTEEL